ncbi:MAG: response regulator [Candidatus Gracilibacteria bacterium]|nr:response regulator [Candidatus Gracilibacteria bacterium]
MTWIGYVGENPEKIVLPMARAGADDGYLDSVVISWDETKENGRGPTGTAIREKRPVYIKNVLTDSDFALWRENAVKRGYHSSLALPLFVKDTVIGALCLYAQEIEVFNDEEVRFLEELSINISQCIEHMRDKDESKRTAELLRKSEKQLQIRQRMDSVGTLASGIAHDFNNLLTIIMGNLGLLKMDASLSESSRDYASNALLSSSHAAELIKKLQRLSENMITEKANIDIYDVVIEVFGLLETTNKIVNKIVDIKKGDFYVMGSLTDLRDVLLNLGTNAFRAIEEKGFKEGDFIRIHADNYTISTPDKTGLPEGDYIHITFEDNGIGMSNKILEGVFDPFVTTKPRGEDRGSGLGMAIVYNIITNIHKGHISMESEEGVGTTVHLYLPKAKMVEKTKTSEEVSKCSGDETILVVEDNEMIRNFVKTVLERCGYKVITAKDGKEGLDTYIANMNTIDMVILDLTMPHMSGQTVFEEMLKIKSNVKVIISSGQGNGEIREGVLSKAKGYIHKPYEISTLTDTVRAILDMRNGG